MTIANTNRNDVDAGDLAETQCLLYLLGELDTEASERFEGKLRDDPGLCETLLQQANLISAVARTSDVAIRPVQPVSLGRTYELRRVRWITASISIAACIALVFQVVRFAAEPTRVTSTSRASSIEPSSGLDETMLIAKAWASSQYNMQADALNSEMMESNPDVFAGASSDDSLDMVLDEQRSDIDSTMSWMFVAISSSSEMQTDEGNDG